MLRRREPLICMNQPSPLQAPMVHRKNVVGFRQACEEMWGREGLARVTQALSPAVRDATVGLLPLPEWLPVECMSEWAEAVWLGPAMRDEARYRVYVSKAICLGFGRVKQFLLGMLTPERLMQRTGELWRGEYSTGELRGEIVGPGRCRLVLDHHPYIERTTLRLAVAESFRTSLSLTRAREVTETHPPAGRPLVVTIRWAVAG